MKGTFHRWLCEVSNALDQASRERGAPEFDLAWLRERSHDTMSMSGDVRELSVEHMVADLADLLREYPTKVPEPLLRVAMATPGRDLPAALLRTEALCLDLPGAPRWGSVMMSAPLNLSAAGPVHVMKEDVVAAHDYVQRFSQLLTLGYSSINLGVAGIWRGALLVMVEMSCDHENASAVTLVNASGPLAFVRRRVGWSLDDIVIVEDSP